MSDFALFFVSVLVLVHVFVIVFGRSSMEICKRARQLLVVCSQKESRGGGRRRVVVVEAWDGMQSEQS